MTAKEDLIGHLALGRTTVARCWSVKRKDGVTYGFTDHDCRLSFEGITFEADTGLTASALQQMTGLAVDNSEALGALSSAAIDEADIKSGRFDGAEVCAWLVNWENPDQRWLQFRGSFGEIRRAGGAFQAELRGLSEAFNQVHGFVFHADCSAVLGDKRCKFDLSKPGYFHEAPVIHVEDALRFTFEYPGGFDKGWFERGRLTVLSGTGLGLSGQIKNDRLSDDNWAIELWESLRSDIKSGDIVRIEAGCDKRRSTCRLKFDNFLNFRGFPDIPGDDWLMSYPTSGGANDGGSLKQ